MEKSMALNGRAAGTDEREKKVQDAAGNGRRRHAMIWREIFRELHNHWEEAEHGTRRRSAL
ncbi:MAG: hypothetical protein PVJ01_07555 [Pseudomonadota bacterium]|jgi:hypothetical protein